MATTFFGRLYDPDRKGLCAVTFEDGRVRSIKGADQAPDGAIGSAQHLIVPGFVDLQVNGAGGVDFMDVAADVDRARRTLAAVGITSFLATTVTAPADRLVERIGALAPADHAGTARLLGVHVEGPFIAPARRGAHDASTIRPPDAGEAARWCTAGAVRLVTLAPELDGAGGVIDALRARGVLVSAGHSDATADQALDGEDAGIGLATHLFNAMPPLGHRAPGLAGQVLLSQVPASIIADGVHVDPLVLQLAWRLKGADGLALITDAVAGLGTAPGPTTLGDVTTTHDGRVARHADGTLAGSTTEPAVALRVLRDAGVPIEDAVAIATRTPARLLALGDGSGCLRVGGRADAVLLDRSLAVVAVIAGGDLASTDG